MALSAITCVVPTRNEAHNIERFLGSLPRDLSLIVVDSSDDNTAEALLRHRPNKTTLISKRATIPEARQLGAEAARSEWLLFTDADIVFPEHYFPTLVRYLDRDCVYGSKLSLDRYRAYYRAIGAGQHLSDRIGIPAASGSNMAVRRRALAAAGGFDLRLTCNEDSELVWRIKHRGFRVRYAPDIPVYATDHRRLDRGIARKTAHSIVRCLALYSGLGPDDWRTNDWGYWSHHRREDEA